MTPTVYCVCCDPQGEKESFAKILQAFEARVNLKAMELMDACVKVKVEKLTAELQHRNDELTRKLTQVIVWTYTLRTC